MVLLGRVSKLLLISVAAKHLAYSYKSMGQANVSPQQPLGSAKLLLRKAEVFATAIRVFGDYKLLQWRCNQIADTPEGEELKNKLWDQAHERNAVYLYSKFSSLAALWVKLGQYLSSRADIMPDAYLKELSKCKQKCY